VKTSWFVPFLALILSSAASLAGATPKVLMVSAEKAGVLQTGGLGHAVAGLAQALNAEKISTDILMPFYLQMNAPANLQATSGHFEVPLDWRQGSLRRVSEFSLFRAGGEASAQTLFLKHIPASGQQNYFDNRTADGKKTYGPDVTLGEAFAAWSKAAADYILSQNYDVVILNDWHTGLIALHLQMAKERGLKVPKVVMAIHNIAFQGTYSHEMYRFLGLPEKYFTAENGVEFYGQMNFLKAGMQYSDLLYTVSTGYAKEIASPLFGAGLDGLVRRLQREYRVTGVLNGIINEHWEPKNFSAEDLSGKSQGKAGVQEEMGLPVKADVPLFVLTSRVAEQKGFEYLIGALQETATAQDAQFIVIGDGDAKYIEKLEALQKRFPDKIRYRGFSEALEKQLTACGDFFINGAWFEPSGLNQFFAMKNGTIPVLSQVGGLADSIKEGETGFFFKVKWNADLKGYDREATQASVVQTLAKAIQVYKTQPQKITRMRQREMREDNSWKKRVQAEIVPLLDFTLTNGPAKLRASHALQSSEGYGPTDLLRASGGAPSRGPRCELVF
jgi:starch synthase